MDREYSFGIHIFLFYYQIFMSLFFCLINSHNVQQKSCMVCGIDVYHSAVGGGRSVAGFVSSLDPQLTKWHSKICMQSSKQELVDMLQVCLISAINAFQKVINNITHVLNTLHYARLEC